MAKINIICCRAVLKVENRRTIKLDMLFKAHKQLSVCVLKAGFYLPKNPGQP